MVDPFGTFGPFGLFGLFAPPALFALFALFGLFGPFALFGLFGPFGVQFPTVWFIAQGSFPGLVDKVRPDKCENSENLHASIIFENM